MRRVVQNHDENGPAASARPATCRASIMARHRADVLLGTRHGNIPRRQLGEVSEPGYCPKRSRSRTSRSPPSPPNFLQALGWEVPAGALTMVDKNGALDNTSSYIGSQPDRRIGLVIMTTGATSTLPKSVAVRSCVLAGPRRCSQGARTLERQEDSSPFGAA